VVLESLRHMRGTDGGGAVEIGDRAGELEHAMIAADGEVKARHEGTKQRLRPRPCLVAGVLFNLFVLPSETDIALDLQLVRGGRFLTSTADGEYEYLIRFGAMLVVNGVTRPVREHPAHMVRI
jgi:hypothetical protein